MNQNNQLRIQKQKERSKSQHQSKKNTKECDDHSFCSIKYEFSESNTDNLTREEDRARVRSLQRYNYLKLRQQENPSFNLSQISEEALDDWILQSFNRPLSQALDTKKKFEMPLQYQDELKSRYSHQRNNKMLIENSKEYYFQEQIPQKSQKFIIQNGKSILNPMNLLFDHKLLEPKLIWPGQPIAIREDTKLKKLRGASQKEMDESTRVKSKSVKADSVNKQVPIKRIQTSYKKQSITTEKQERGPIEEHLFLQNYDNFTRDKSNKDEVLTSFAQKELNEIDSQIQQKKRIHSAAEYQVQNSYLGQDELPSMEFTSQKQQAQYYAIQHQSFKKQMNSMVQDFKAFLHNKEGETKQNPIQKSSQEITESVIQETQQEPDIKSSIVLNDNSFLSPSIISFLSNQKYRGYEYLYYHKQQLPEHLKKSIERQTEKMKDADQSSLFNDADSIIHKQSFIRKLNNSQQQNKILQSSQFKVTQRPTLQSRKSQRPSTQGSSRTKSRSVAYKMMQWYSSESDNYQGQLQQQQEIRPDNIQDSLAQSRKTTLNGKKKNTESIQSQYQAQFQTSRKPLFINNIENEIQQMNNERSQDYAPSLPGEMANIDQIIKQPNESKLKKKEIVDKFDEIVEESCKQQSKFSQIYLDTSKYSAKSYKSTKFEQQSLNLQLKSKKLLDTVSEERIKYKPELIGFNAQLVPQTTLFKAKNLSNSEYWFNKGVKALKEDVNVSLHCFKQALIENPLLLEAIQNIGIIYEKRGKYSTAQKWFQLALQFKESHELKFGLAICLYKMAQFQSAYAILDDIIEKSHETIYVYLRGICAKRMFDLENAAINYKIVQETSKATNFQLCVDFMMAVLFSDLRQMEIKFNPYYFCQFHKLVTQIVESDDYEQKLVQFWNPSKQAWQRQNDLLVILQRLSFFKRFAISVLRQFLSVIFLNVIEKESVIFPKENEVHIIVAGNVNVYDHRESYKRPEIISTYREGDIIGCPNRDNGLCIISDIWFLTKTQIEIISINKNHFEDLWQAQIQSNGLEMLTRLEKLSIFKGVSTLTLYRLVYELMKKQEHKKNTILFNDNSYSETYEYIHLRKPTKSSLYQLKKLLKPHQSSYQCKLKKLILKHRISINKLKYSKNYINGFYIILSGECELENPNGFNNFYLGYGDYFGESLLFETKSYNSYGRLRVCSETAQVYFLNRLDFTHIPTLDVQQIIYYLQLKIMEQNCIARKEINDLDQIYQNRMHVQKLKRNRKFDF